MKFLDQPNPEEEKKEVIKIIKKFEMNLDCQACNQYQTMEGGPQDSKNAEAVFQCPNCGFLNSIKWGFDF